VCKCSAQDGCRRETQTLSGKWGAPAGWGHPVKHRGGSGVHQGLAEAPAALGKGQHCARGWGRPHTPCAWNSDMERVQEETSPEWQRLWVRPWLRPKRRWGRRDTQFLGSGVGARASGLGAGMLPPPSAFPVLPIPTQAAKPSGAEPGAGAEGWEEGGSGRDDHEHSLGVPVLFTCRCPGAWWHSVSPYDGGCSQGQSRARGQRSGGTTRDPSRCWDVPTGRGGHVKETTRHPGNMISPAMA